MKITESLFGKTADGQKVKEFTADGGAISFSVTEFGATLRSLSFNGKNMILGYDRLDDYKDLDGYLGATVGRYANRIGGGRFTLNGKTYDLYKNDNGNTLHGGKVGFSHKKWQGTPDEKNGCVTFRRVSAGGEENFPAALDVSVTFRLLADGIGIEYSALSDGDTIVNLTNHAYFNLTGGKKSVEEHFLTVNADAFTPTDKFLIPTGEMRPVKNTPFDFTVAKRIGDDINADDEQLKFAGGYDHNFVLRGEGLRKAATVYSPSSGITLDCFTDAAGIQVYSGNFLTDRQTAGGITVHKRYGLCLETQFFPDAINKANFPSPVLRAGEKFHSVTEYRFKNNYA